MARADPSETGRCLWTSQRASAAAQTLLSGLSQDRSRYDVCRPNLRLLLTHFLYLQISKCFVRFSLMASFTFSSLVEIMPENIDPWVREEFLRNGEEAVGIAPDAGFDLINKIGAVRSIGDLSFFGAGVVLGDGVMIGGDVTVGAYSVLERNVRISDGFNIQYAAYFSDGSSVDPKDPSYKGHSYMREIQDGVIVGPKVALPSDVQLGTNAVIPTQDSIVQVGRYGESQRMVTIYGSDGGPLYSVACQSGIDMPKLRTRIIGNEGTSPESAAGYRPHIPLFEELGVVVQQVFEREANLVEELIEKRDEALQKIRMGI